MVGNRLKSGQESQLFAQVQREIETVWSRMLVTEMDFIVVALYSSCSKTLTSGINQVARTLPRDMGQMINRGSWIYLKPFESYQTVNVAVGISRIFPSLRHVKVTLLLRYATCWFNTFDQCRAHDKDSSRKRKKWKIWPIKSSLVSPQSIRSCRPYTWAIDRYNHRRSPLNIFCGVQNNAKTRSMNSV